MDARPLSWADLQVFLATARGGTLAAAAEALGISTATVHRRLSRLEAVLKSRLFARSPRGYALTPQGRELLEHASTIDDRVQAARRRLGGSEPGLSGTVRISTVDDLLLVLLGRSLNDFAQLHPRVCLDVGVDTGHADLASGQADVAVRPGWPPTRGDVIARRVCGIGLCFYASRDYLRRHGGTASPDELARHRLVRADERLQHLPLERVIDELAPQATVAFRSNAMLARLVAVREGLGIGLLPCFAADREPGLARIGSVRRELDAALWILVHADLRRHARVRALVEHLHHDLVALAPQIEGR